MVLSSLTIRKKHQSALKYIATLPKINKWFSLPCGQKDESPEMKRKPQKEENVRKQGR